MEDSRQIENLIYRYAEHIDNGDLEAVAELFREAEIVSSDHDSRLAGFDEVLKMYQLSCRLHETTGTPLTKHLTTNVIIELEDSHVDASARSYYTVIQATASLPLQPIISGRYKDRFRKVEGVWIFIRREMFVDLIGDCSAHLLYDVQSLK
jgi:3-phenylpropionate/cinnamic acid dioxygenase small subunit|tara:strand:- start:48662 stop:49114 length:453 start_codon:yes stop_codon:yes gene_type:complete